MFAHCKRLVALALLLAIGAVPTLPAADPKEETGFVPLFNGKDLTGWKYGKDVLDGKTETPDGRFVVKDGTIVALAADKKGGKGIKDLNSAKEYNNAFVLRLQFKAAPKSDSGVYIRGQQQQVRDFIRRGEMKNLEKVFKNDAWNDLEFIVAPGKARYLVNGKELDAKDKFELVIEAGKAVGKLNGKDLAVTNYQFKEDAVASATLNGEKLGTLNVPLKGGIGLQAETLEFAFKNVRIKEVPR